MFFGNCFVRVFALQGVMHSNILHCCCYGMTSDATAVLRTPAHQQKLIRSIVSACLLHPCAEVLLIHTALLAGWDDTHMQTYTVVSSCNLSVVLSENVG